ncbi:MAG: hypothetical protein A2W93_11345 [Bacteroidetes bacterium GWF2_43_63]|nr:MAG: hypothetical protein A2W94_14220 [Bacteroidetes bacterium GWE2_42_42]OFY54868.1 MAG: hypothetical protein A2W93_11345 [Bacteroidetes bacterium GWF2_43_63]HCB63228.1 TetR/AcrR family transcriptional regulator [Bacteroidales bacterium]HCY22167.1 TetR/AcrR family transcriptional regulator [Bacteroidales bacterium]
MSVNNEQNMEKTILEAAEKLFLEKGFAMVSTTQIAKAAGCNQALVHYYYRTKDRLFEAIFADKLKTFFSVIFQTHDESLTFEEKLKKYIGAHFDMLMANPKLPFLVVNELTTNPSRIDSLKEMLGPTINHAYEPFQKELDVEIEAGRVRPISIPDIIYSMVALNVMVFIGTPIMKKILFLDESHFNYMLQYRKEENIRIILSSLKPDAETEKIAKSKKRK